MCPPSLAGEQHRTPVAIASMFEQPVERRQLVLAVDQQRAADRHNHQSSMT